MGLIGLPPHPQVLALGEPTHLAQSLPLLRNRLFKHLALAIGPSCLRPTAWELFFFRSFNRNCSTVNCPARGAKQVLPRVEDFWKHHIFRAGA